MKKVVSSNSCPALTTPKKLLMDLSKPSGFKLVDLWATDAYWATFKPYFQLGRAFGSCYKLCARNWQKFFNVYCAFNFVLIFYNMCRGISFLKFDGFSSVLVFKFLLLLYATHCMGAYLFLIWLQKNDGIANFVRDWRAVHNADPNPPYIDWIKRITRCGILYAVGISVVNGLFVALGSMNVLIKFPFMDSYFILPQLKLANGLNVFFTSVSFSLSQAVYLSVCAVLCFEFYNFEQNLASLSAEQCLLNIRDYRWQHFEIIKLTHQADDMLSYYAFVIFGLNSPTLVITAFLLARDKELLDPASLFTFVTWLMVLVLQIGIVSVLPAILNYFAHKPLQVLETVSYVLRPNPDDVFSSTTENFREVSLFIHQLTDQPISITGGGFFVIDKSMLLTLSSGVITYFAVLLQFDMAARMKCHCNCTFVEDAMQW